MPFKTRQQFPHEYRVVSHVWIPMRDGTRLSGRLWLPAGCESRPAPAIFEYIPYRKNDVYAEGDQRRFGYLAGHGYAGVRVDMRGAGDSEGTFVDEYSPIEQQDALDVIAWIAAQPWCTGKVGMIGISWGGYSALQAASHAPQALAAVITLGFSDDRYEDDVHYVGGCLFARHQLQWATTVLGYMARPPDPLTVGSHWRSRWMERLGRAVPVIEPWLTHQHYDAYWKYGSICEDYASVQCPVFAVGGWLDGYTNAVLRMLEHCPGPCLGLIGPWGHQNPYYGVPGPAIGWLQESLRWWDHWLKGIDTGIMAEPKLRFYRQDALAPGTAPAVRPGRWAAESAWPSPGMSPLRLSLGPGTLGSASTQSVTLTHIGQLAAASDPGNWTGFAQVTDLPGEQRAEDGRSLIFDGEPLATALDILGQPLARLELAVDGELALVAVRLCDVCPDGRSTLITRGFLNLTHRRSREHPEPLVPGEAFAVDVRLKAISYVVPAGHRLRLAISTSYWPWLWPSPMLVTLSLRVGGDSLLEVPIRGADAADYAVPAHFDEPEAAPGLGIEFVHEPRGGRTITWDVGSGRQLIVDSPAFFASARLPLQGGLEFSDDQTDEFEITEGDPLSATMRCRRSLRIGRGTWQTRIEVNSTMTSTRAVFLVTTLLEAFEGGQRVHAGSWTHTIPRRLV